MIRKAKPVWILCLCLAALTGDARAELWGIVPGDDRTEVRFHSEATMESFDGVTRNAEGWLSIAAGDSISWLVSVDLASMDTGIGLRNRHMRDNHLHTDEFPEAVFSGSMAWPAEIPPLERGVEVELGLAGRFELHGVSRERMIPVSLSRQGDFVEAGATFEVSLADHDIPLPKFLMMKLADVQQVSVRLLARKKEGD